MKIFDWVKALPEAIENYISSYHRSIKKENPNELDQTFSQPEPNQQIIKKEIKEKAKLDEEKTIAKTRTKRIIHKPVWVLL